MSSLKDEITGQTLANQIMLERAAHSGSFFLVEGSSDASLFKRFTDSGNCSIVVCTGWERLTQAISILTRRGFEGALGFCDRDYCNKTGYPEYDGVIVFTDENDFEAQIIHSEALDKVLDEFGNHTLVSAELASEGASASELLFRWSQATGALRLSSAQNCWNLKFNGITYKFMDQNSPELCPIKTVQNVVGRSINDGLPNVCLIQDIVTRCIASFSENELINGHDCVAVLGKALRKRFGRTNRFDSPNGRDDLAKILRIAYEFAFFQKTRGYHEIRRWEIATGHSILRDA